MAYEPLQTDERIEGPPRKTRDFDTQMLFGCTSFVTASLLTYVLATWPWIAFPDTHLLSNVGLVILIGLGPASILGAVTTRKGGLAGACGFLGGILASAIFLHLRLEQHMLGRLVRELPRPEYPDSWKYLLPMAYVLAAGLVIFLFLPRSEFQDEPRTDSRRKS